MPLKLAQALGTLLAFKQHSLTIYSCLAAHPAPDVAEFMNRLVADEKELVRRLEQGMAEHGITAAPADPSALTDLLSAEYFGLHEGVLGDREPQTREAAIDIAIQFEKDALLLFTEIWAVAETTEGHEVIHGLIASEKKHLLELLNLRNQPREAAPEERPGA